ncbi:hypothetical protein NC796_24085 [Aliifodinibius sp. S!AR15-10]|uniref:flagellar hook assembly protein FlgD n=1 Tax=Aliifodinibius sp. S!AR15-10 TaxID=2950437 RepID=UPI00286565BA|nr:flagellar hook capping FlgD N-terminal domain-containing protein [Aliifodinibius sp. S!AR15-10]MDR8394250.1 hypothetical protein [Aliifodinibius sp. S!AR15-10]
MDISNITSQATATASQAQSNDKKKLGQEQFLQLLVAQMRNQDPINPMDGKEFASQLAQFNSVEQLVNVNDGLKSLQKSQEMMQMGMTNSMAASLTGKEVRALSSKVHLAPGEEADINYKLNSSAEQVDIVIKDGSGTEVRRASLEGVGSGENSWTWDGKNGSGARMPDGNYTVEIQASSGDSRVKALTFTEGIAKKVRFGSNGVMLTVNNVEVPIGDVEAVGKGIL